MEAAQSKLFIEKECQKLAVFGLGGVGKTQFALQLAYWAKTHQPAYSIFWAPALSDATFEQAYMEIVRKLPIEKADPGQDPKDLVRRYLSSEAAGPWLLVVDNADDEELLLGPSYGGGGINSHIPISDLGLVLLTTRSRKVAVSFAGGDIINLDSMGQAEATDLLKKQLAPGNIPSGESAELLKELAYLPLAITQATSYINTNQISITKYLTLLRSTEQGAVNLLSGEFHDHTRYAGSQNAVATTWLVSFEQIRKSDPNAAELLSFLSCIEPKGIPQSILPKLEPEQMTRAVGTLCGYAFLTQRGDADVFDMHSLVHLATLVWTKRERLNTVAVTKAVGHLSKIFPKNKWENRDLWREFLPHAFKLLRHSTQEEPDSRDKFRLFIMVGKCLRVDGRMKESLQYLEEGNRFAVMHLSDSDPSRLASQHALASAYESNGQVKEAVALLEQVVAIEAKILAETHPNRLTSQHALASAYESNGQVKEAVALLEQVIAIKVKTLAETHPDRLASQHALASAYKSNGQVREAVTLLEQVVAIKAKILAETHPSRLASQHVLAVCYYKSGQVERGIQLMRTVVTFISTTFAENHSSRLGSEGWLAHMLRERGGES